MTETATPTIPADLLQRAYAALDDNLGVPAVLELLVGLERDSAVPGGAKFETFAHLEHLRIDGEMRRRNNEGVLEYSMTQ